VLSNADLGELLALAGREESDHRRRALERASRAARFWPREAEEIVGAGGSLTELNAVGPWVAARIQGWLDDPPDVPEPQETRRGFLTHAQVRNVLDADPRWESEPCGDLQMHTTFSDGSLPLADMVAAARSVGRSFVAVTDHSESLKIAHGMTQEELAEQAEAIDGMNSSFADEGTTFRVLRSMEVDVFSDGSMDMDEVSLASLDLVLGAFHSNLRSKADETERYLAALRQPRLPYIRAFGCASTCRRGWRSAAR